MLNPTGSEAFIKIFNNLAKHKHRYAVFSDFVTLSAISVHNAVHKSEDLESEYMTIISGYSKEEGIAFSHLFAELIMLLEFEPTDILGGLYMSLDLGNKGTGQFFTPSPVSSMMAQIVYGEKLVLPEEGFITMSEPACGAGGMVLAFVKKLIEQKHNPLHTFWVQCIDLDRVAALMCYLQLSLWHVPAQVIVGNTLSMKFREVFHTPAHYLGFWEGKIKRHDEKQIKTKTTVDNHQQEKNKPATPSSEIINLDDMVQTDLFENLWAFAQRFF